MSYVPFSAVRRTIRLALAGATALLLPACAGEDAVGPRSVETQPPPRYSFTRAPGLPPLHSNRVKYRNRGKKAGTGRSGSANVSVRALQGPATASRPGETLLEITTGTFDGGARPPGTLTKIQVKQFDAAGHLLATRNFNKPTNGGYAKFAFPNVSPGTTFQVTAHAKGIDGKRTSVVTVLEQVKTRPDLVASDLQAPTRALPNAPVNISVLVSEMNGDVGARADCLLLVDGREVDRAAGIWVDASSSVNCAFTHAFADEGVKQLAVLVQGVTPGDWDTANNAVTGQITINSLQDFYYEARAREFEAHYRVDRVTQIRRFTSSTGALQWTQEQTDLDEIEWIDHQFADHFAFLPIELQFPIASLEMDHSTDGTALASLRATNIEAQWGDSYDSPEEGFRYTCAADFVEGLAVTHLYMEVCARLDYSIVNGTRIEFPATLVSHWRWAGEVTFLSNGFYERRFGDGSSETSVWVFNASQQAGPRPKIALGQTYTMSFAVQGSEPGARTYGSTAVVPLDRVHVPWWIEFGLSTDARWQRSQPCFDFRLDDDAFYELWHVCEVLLDYEAGRSGFVSNLPPGTR